MDKSFVHDGVPSLFPFPEGWYLVARREAIEKQGLIGKTWLGERIVAWCDHAGAIGVASSVCPHMGADLWPETGGQIREGRLVCPYHGYEYDIKGRCVATPHSTEPSTARLKQFEIREIEGMIFGWWGIGGREPQWELPAPPGSAMDWGSPELWTTQFRGHPQEIAENAVDLAHLRHVHGYDSVNNVGSVEVEGSCLKSSFYFERKKTIAGINLGNYEVTADAQLHGLGYSLIEVHEQFIGMNSRLWVLATPIDGEVVELTLVSQLRGMLRPKRPIVGLRFLPLQLRNRLMNKILVSGIRNDVLQDVVIWSRKHYLPYPFFDHFDDEIRVYRNYCKQFYPEGKVALRSSQT